RANPSQSVMRSAMVHSLFSPESPLSNRPASGQRSRTRSNLIVLKSPVYDQRSHESANTKGNGLMIQNKLPRVDQSPQGIGKQGAAIVHGLAIIGEVLPVCFSRPARQGGQEQFLENLVVG